MGDSSLLSSSAASCGGGQRCQGMAPCLNIQRIQDCFKAGKSVALPLFVSKPQRLTAGDEDGGWCRPVCAKQDYLFSSMFGG